MKHFKKSAWQRSLRKSSGLVIQVTWQVQVHVGLPTRKRLDDPLWIDVAFTGRFPKR